MARTPLDILIDRADMRCTVCGTPRAEGCLCWITLRCPKCKRTKIGKREKGDPPGPVVNLTCDRCG